MPFPALYMVSPLGGPDSAKPLPPTRLMTTEKLNFKLERGTIYVGILQLKGRTDHPQAWALIIKTPLDSPRNLGIQNQLRKCRASQTS